MLLNFVPRYNDTGSELKLHATSWNLNPNADLDKSCLWSIAEYIFSMTEEYRGRYFSNCVCIGFHGSMLFLCITEDKDNSWYKSLLCINHLDCFSPSLIIADMLTYVAFGKSVDGSLILQSFIFEHEQIYW